MSFLNKIKMEISKFIYGKPAVSVSLEFLQDEKTSKVYIVAHFQGKLDLVKLFMTPKLSKIVDKIINDEDLNLEDIDNADFGVRDALLDEDDLMIEVVVTASAVGRYITNYNGLLESIRDTIREN